jgi:hypothetical protein
LVTFYINFVGKSMLFRVGGWQDVAGMHRNMQVRFISTPRGGATTINEKPECCSSPEIPPTLLKERYPEGVVLGTTL